MKSYPAAMFALLAGCPVLAQESQPKVQPPGESAVAETPEEAKRGESKQVVRLSEEFGVPQQDIQALRDKKMGWGEIRHALAISRRSEKPLSEVLALRESGLGWGQIARKFGFRLGEVERRSSRPDKAGPREGPRGQARARTRGPKR